MSTTSGIADVAPTQALSEESAKVLKALNNKDFVWRTVDGVAKETQLPEQVVLTILNSLPADILATASSKKGQLYTTREHYYGSQSFFGRFLTAATGQFK